MKKTVCALLFFPCFFFAFSPTVHSQIGYSKGKNHFTVRVDGDAREYYVHVPKNYQPKRKTAVVLMLHGTSGTGNKFYRISGWKELGDRENVLTVFPSSWEYCIHSQGQTYTTTKWNVYPTSSYSYCSGQTPRNDIKFLNKIVSQLHKKFNVDNRRIYLVGFSNGGAMAFRCAVEMSSVFAAIVEASGTATLVDTYQPIQNIPIALQVGSVEINIPMQAFQHALKNNLSLQTAIGNHANNFNFSTNSNITGNPNHMLTATFQSIPAADPREFVIMLVKNLGHKYPNGRNHPMRAAKVHWDWFKRFSLR